MKLTNRWNRFIYRLWSPIYDGLFGRFFAAPGRRRALEVLDLRPGERIVLVGVGTGADLPLLPAGVSAVGVDLSPHMLGRAQAKGPCLTVTWSWFAAMPRHSRSPQGNSTQRCCT